jgi:UDP-N-acetylglucosamine--N-acetylmuramyl-(pentapeptide) pyrophosphoryl-undecaprenol N-acetylglucosamine transferase
MRCVIAGGGTGGHLFPGMAIAQAFMEREMGNKVLFIGTERGIETTVLAGGEFPLRTIHAKPLKGRSLLGKLEALWAIPKATGEALRILKGFRPDIVLGVGGYASGPALLAASLLGVKKAIHEQNVVPGLTNRILRWFSHRIFVSFEETKKYFPEAKTIVTGTPVRKELSISLPSTQPLQGLTAGTACTQATEGESERKGDQFTLLVFGGSAGSHRINQAMMEALGDLEGRKHSLRIFHQTGTEDFNQVSKHYQAEGFEAVVKPFFKEMATYYQLSDLVVCRSGASTIAELALCGKPAILIPYPYAAHQHQFVNAQKLVDLGAAIMIRDEALNGPLLARIVLDLCDHPKERRRMGAAIQRIGRPRAAQEIVDHCYTLMRAGG